MRYILFSYDRYELKSAQESIVGTYETLQEAKKQADEQIEMSEYRAVEIYDCVDHWFVWSSRRSGWNDGVGWEWLNRLKDWIKGI